MAGGKRLVTTPTGNTGRGVLATVMSADPSVRVLVRDRAKLADAPADVIEGDLREDASLAAALAGAETAFFCVPQSENPADLGAYFKSFAIPFAAAASASRLSRVVVISGGDDEGENTGPGKALRSNEDILANAIPSCRFVRCGYFMENLLWQVQTIAHAGFFTLPVAPDVPMAFVAADDIGAASGRLMLAKVGPTRVRSRPMVRLRSPWQRQRRSSASLSVSGSAMSTPIRAHGRCRCRAMA